MDVALFIEHGPDAGRVVPLTGSVVVGRAAEAQLRVDHPSVSRRHARLAVSDEAVVLEDLGSHNGTFLNGKRVRRPVDAQVGDRIRVGDVRLQLRGSPTQAPGAPPRRSGWALAAASAAMGLALGSAAVAASRPEAVRQLLIRAKRAPVEAPRPAPPTPPVASAAPAPEAAPKPAVVLGLDLRTEPVERSASRTARPARRAPPKPPRSEDEPPPTLSGSEVHRAYETGDLDAAIAAAEQLGRKDLAKRIAKVRRELSSGRASLAGGDDDAALAAFERAAALDERISGGWGAPGAEIAEALTDLYTRRARRHIDAGNFAEARRALVAALRYGPSDPAALAERARLPPMPPE